MNKLKSIIVTIYLTLLAMFYIIFTEYLKPILYVIIIGLTIICVEQHYSTKTIIKERNELIINNTVYKQLNSNLFKILDNSLTQTELCLKYKTDTFDFYNVYKNDTIFNNELYRLNIENKKLLRIKLQIK